MKTTRFCPTLYPGKKLHLGHLFNLALTLRWANQNDASFFYLIELDGAESIPSLPDPYTDWRHKNPTRMLSQWWGYTFDKDVLEAIAVLQQLYPAPMCTTLFSTVAEQDRLRGTTDIFRGSYCEGAYQPDGIGVHQWPMLYHPNDGNINQNTFNGGLSLEGMAARFPTQSLLEIWLKAIRYSLQVTATDIGPTIRFSPAEWEAVLPMPSTAFNTIGHNRAVIDEIGRLLETNQQ